MNERDYVEKWKLPVGKMLIYNVKPFNKSPTIPVHRWSFRVRHYYHLLWPPAIHHTSTWNGEIFFKKINNPRPGKFWLQLGCCCNYSIPLNGRSDGEEREELYFDNTGGTSSTWHKLFNVCLSQIYLILIRCSTELPSLLLAALHGKVVASPLCPLIMSNWI